MSVRAAPPCPANDLAYRNPIQFLHPYYKTNLLHGFDILLQLPRVDAVPSKPDKFGIHHATALLACQIVANNAFNGYLSTSPKEGGRITTAADDVLLEDWYIFIVPGDASYPVVPSFNDWMFPHAEFEHLWWPDIPTRQDRLPRFPRLLGCHVTQCSYPIEIAHLVPQCESDWYIRNGMQIYLDPSPEQGIHHRANQLGLRTDTHRYFEKKDWVIIPKPTHSDPAFAYAVHVLGNDGPAAEFHSTWHNSQVLNLPRHSEAYLFARFAYAVFQLVKPFILYPYGLRKVVRVFVDAKGCSTWKTRPESAQVLDLLYGGGFLRSVESDSETERGEEEEDDSSTKTDSPLDPVDLEARLERVKRQRIS